MSTSSVLGHWLKDVAKFSQEVTNLKAPEKPGLQSQDRAVFFAEAAREEIDEFLDAHDRMNLADAADAVIDLIYFSLQCLFEMGVPADVAFNDVHSANMKKHQGRKAARKVTHDHDAVKPADWVPPDHTWLAYLTKDDIGVAKARANLDRILKTDAI